MKLSKKLLNKQAIKSVFSDSRYVKEQYAPTYFLVWAHVHGNIIIYTSLRTKRNIRRPAIDYHQSITSIWSDKMAKGCIHLC